MATWSAPATAVTPDLSGTWRSAPEETKLTTDFDVSVWGKSATAVRTVELAVKAGGAATLVVTRKVVDGRGRTVRGSLSIEEAQLIIGPLEKTGAARTDLSVRVERAARRYPDEPGSTWPLEGVRVGVSTLDDTPGTIEVRFETPDGRGSFWETLRRGTPPRRDTQLRRDTQKRSSTP